MFWKRDKSPEAVTKAVKEVSFIHANTAGASRRATSLIPIASGTHEIAHTSTVRFHQLLVSLEGNQRTGCLRIISPKRKSRSAILIYRGRVLGCLYGSKRLNGQILQQDAHSRALADLAEPGNILDAYELPDELVLAAASLFNGDILDIDMQQESSQMLDQAMRAIADSKLPGCVIISTVDEEMVCMVYLFDGKIIGVFSASDGWVKPSYEAAMQYVQISKPTKAMASYLTVTEPELAAQLGFSLTGLDSVVQRRVELASQQMQAIDAFSQITTGTQTYSQIEPNIKHEKPKKEARRWNSQQISTVPSHNTFAIAP